MKSFKHYFENSSSLLNVSLNAPLRHDRRNKERGINRKHQNIIPNKYKLQPDELQCIKSLQSGSHTRVHVDKANLAMLCSKYNLRLTPGEEKCINSNSRIYVMMNPNGEGEVYKK